MSYLDTLFGETHTYQKNDDGSTSTSVIPGVISSGLGNEMTYQRLYKDQPQKPQTQPPSQRSEPTIGEAVTSSGGGGGGVPTPSLQDQLNAAQQQALQIQSGIGNLREQTIDEALGGNFNTPTPQGFGDPDVESYLSGLAKNPVNENNIRDQIMRMYQGQIDAVNESYNAIRGEAELEGQGRLGSQRAIAARGGLLGSDFAGAQKDKVQGFNRDIMRGIEAERNAKIGAIMGIVSSQAAEQINAKNQARMQGAEAYLNYLSSAGERKQANLAGLGAAFVQQGMDPADMDETQLKEIAKQYGASTQDIINSYSQAQSQAAEADLETRKTEAEINKIEADIEAGKIKTIGEGTMLYNTETGETFKNPKTYKPDGPSGLSTPSGNFSQEQIADVHAYLSENRGEDGYTDTQKYMDELNGFVDLGGDPKDFIKEYEPDTYINPNDQTRSFLQQYMRKTVTEDVNEIDQTISALQGLRSNDE